MLSQTAAFAHLVRDHMGPAPVDCPADLECRELVARFRGTPSSCAIITESAGQPVGILTEQDICRRIAFQVAPETPVAQVMTTPVHCIRDDDYLYHGVATMRRLGLRHMPVVDRHGVVVGVLNLDESLAATASRLIAHIEELSHPLTLEGLKTTKRAQADVAAGLLDDTVPTPEIQWLLSRVNMDLHRRVAAMCEEQMLAEGHGEAPVEFDVIVMGSGGRGESYLNPDQDNGFVLDDYPDADHERNDAWFEELAKRFTTTLADVGFELCEGEVMATNVRWRKRLQDFEAQTGEWIGKARGDALRYCDIFFDFKHCYGQGRLAGRLRDYVTENARRAHFLLQMYRLDQKHRGALGTFGRLLTDPNEGPNQGKIDLKLAGSMPLVGAVRLLALREGIRATSTEERMRELHERGALSDDEVDYLRGAVTHIGNLLLRQQLQDHRQGKPVGNHVPPSALTERDKDLLVDSFKALRSFHSRLGSLLKSD